MKQSNFRLPLLCCVLAGMAVMGRAETEELTLSPDSSKKIDVPDGVKKLYISNPNIIDARPEDEGYSVLISALSHGKAELRIGRFNTEDLVYKIEVEPKAKGMADKIKTMLEDVDGIDINIVGDMIMIEGEVLTMRAKKRVEEVAGAFKGSVVDLTSLDEVGWNRTRKRALEKEIKLKSVKVKISGDRLQISGSVPSQDELERVKEIAKRLAENSTIMLRVVRPR
jgi:Flp pilus assembly secretin CpaC